MLRSYVNAIAVAQVAFHAVACCIAVALTVRHGLRQPCWLPLVTFTISRIVGAAMQLGTNSAPLNLHLYRGAATLAQIGLSLILFSFLGILVQVKNSAHRRRRTLVQPCITYFQAALLGVAFILGVVGATSVPDSDFEGFTTTKVPSTLTASAVLYTAAFFVFCICTISLWLNIQCVEPAEKRLLIAATASLPFLLVRVIYAALCMFLDNMQFQWFKGCLLRFIVMDLVMEIVVVAIYESAGLLAGCPRLRGTAGRCSREAKGSDRKEDISLSSSCKGSRDGLIAGSEA